MVSLKLDFEKTFDTVDHSFILIVLHAKGFGPTRCNWIKFLLQSATSSVLLNGIPGFTFKCKRGVRQGDPLSPLLFFLAADILQSLVNEAMNNGLLPKPLALQCHPLSLFFSMYMTIFSYYKLMCSNSDISSNCFKILVTFLVSE
jgi:hypothetical protein